MATICWRSTGRHLASIHCPKGPSIISQKLFWYFASASLMHGSHLFLRYDNEKVPSHKRDHTAHTSRSGGGFSGSLHAVADQHHCTALHPTIPLHDQCFCLLLPTGKKSSHRLLFPTFLTPTRLHNELPSNSLSIIRREPAPTAIQTATKAWNAITVALFPKVLARPI